MNPQVLDLEALKQGVTDIIPSVCSMMADCAIYSFHAQNHESGVLLEVEVDIEGGKKEKKTYSVTWKSDPSLMRKSMNDQNRTTDHGAMCMAILLTLDLTPYTEFETSEIGTGFDFWLSTPNETIMGSRLEISGISKSSKTNNVDYRANIKKKQVKKSDSLGKTAYICIIEFGTPKAVFLKK
ncbi:MAG: hypothetical protein RLZZ628_2427 [Bacteroidota bacterium]|jgi:hypothetical protein